MAGVRKWEKEHLWNLLNLTWKEFHTKYPEVKKNTYKGKRAYWRKKITEGNIEMPEQQPSSTWETAAYDKEKQEWVYATLHSYRHDNAEDVSEVYEPAPAANITPINRNRIERLGRKLLVFGDSQIQYMRVYDEFGNDELIPGHDEAALSVIAQLNAHERPDEVVNLSDTIDLAELSRFAPKSDAFHRTLGPSFKRVHDFYAQLRADNPDAKITEVDSNHTARAQKQMLQNYPEWYGFTLPGEDYPLMSYYRLANLAPLDIDFISGYGAAEYIYGEDKNPIIFKHGQFTSSAPGAVVRKEAAANPEVNIVRGHGHNYEAIAQTRRNGTVNHYVQLGTTCSTTGRTQGFNSAMDDFGRPVHTQENWQNQAMMITEYDGVYQFDIINIFRGVAFYNGNVYNGNEEST